MFQKEKIYIAGPECFYTGGYDMLAAMRAESIAKGFGVTLPMIIHWIWKIRISESGQTAFSQI